jgi:hypothetical protein
MSAPRASGATSGVPGKRGLTDSVKVRPRYLRDLIAPRADVRDEVAITTTIEYRAFVDPALVWQWGCKVSPEESLLACLLMLNAMRSGADIDWRMEARGYLARARAQLGRPAAASQEAAATAVETCEGFEEDDTYGPSVCEMEGPDGAPGAQPEAERPDVAHHDPGVPGLEQLLDDSEQIARDLEGQGEREDTFARELVEVVAENRKLLVTVGILVGGYVVATKFVGGRLIIAWGANATGVVFERHLARSLRPTAELEEGLRRLQAVRQEIRSVGSGLNWKVQRQRWALDAAAQIDDNACGPACMEMVLGDRNVARPAQSMIARMARGGIDAPVPTDAWKVQDTLGKINPDGGWQSGHLGSPDSAVWQERARAMSGSGSWIADMREDFSPGAVGHAVVVDGVAADGTVSIRDPWPFKQGAPDSQGAVGTAYEVSWQEFFGRWSGVYTVSSVATP